MDTGLNAVVALIEGKYYRVQDFPYDEVSQKGPRVLRKGVAYRIETDMTRGLFPYRGTLSKKEGFDPYQRQVGIYMRDLGNNRYVMKLARPHNYREAEEYSLDKARDIVAATIDHEYLPDQFMDVKVRLGANGESFLPPIYPDDDPLNTIMKVAIRKKDAPFEPYGKRLEALAVDRTKGVEGINIRNNLRRALKTNHTMSPSKALQISDTWQFQIAIVVADAPGAMHPMFMDGKSALIIYPDGIPFDLKEMELINVDDLVTQGINDTIEEERIERERKTGNYDDEEDDSDD